MATKRTPEYSRARRAYITVVLVAIFVVATIVDTHLNLFLLPVLVSAIALLCAIELWSLRDPKHGLLDQYSSIYLQLLIVVAGTVAVWTVRSTLINWPQALLAVAMPALAQGIVYSYLNRVTASWLKKSKSVSARLLGLHPFKSAPGTTLGSVVISSAAALVVSLPWFLNSPLLSIVAIISALGANLGDVLERQLKHLVGVSDSGERLRSGKSLLSGIEKLITPDGFLDRFSPLFFCAALALILTIIATM